MSLIKYLRLDKVDGSNLSEVPPFRLIEEIYNKLKDAVQYRSIFIESPFPEVSLKLDSDNDAIEFMSTLDSEIDSSVTLKLSYSSSKSLGYLLVIPNMNNITVTHTADIRTSNWHLLNTTLFIFRKVGSNIVLLNKLIDLRRNSFEGFDPSDFSSMDFNTD